MEENRKMADEGTAGTLVFIAAILQLIFFILFLGLGVWNLLWMLPLLVDPFFFLIFGIVFMTSVILFIIWGVFGIIFMILWFMWRSNPSAHKTGLIVTGILGLFLAGFLPGLLALIGGIMAPGEAA